MSEYQRINAANREQVCHFLMEHWFSTKMILRGKEIDLSDADGFFLLLDDKITGLITYKISEQYMEILSLDSLNENRGIGTVLLEKAIQAARENGCKRIVLITTNDNINALRFYQKRGFDMVNFYRNALDISRKIKPEIPLIGDNGIPLRHEIEFEMVL